MTKKQQIIKNITIVFLGILLILTFFSNTIMNITLPEVMVGEISRGTITTQLSVSGATEATDLYNVVMTESRVVDSIPVIEGQVIAEGDVLCYLQGQESAELESVIKQRDAFELEYNKMILKNNITAVELKNVTQNGITLQHCMNVLSTITDKVKYQEALERHILYMELYEKYKTLQDFNEQITTYEAAAMGSQVTAPITGTIVDVKVNSGIRAERDNVAFTILPEGQKLYMKVTMKAENADALTKSTKIEVASPTALRNTNFIFQDAVLDPTSSEGNKIVTFEVQGENVTVGQYFSLIINKKSQQYDMLVSNNAIRRGDEGSYVLKLVQESSSLGNRYYVEKVDVEIIAESDTQKAISGALYGDEYLIIDSNAPITDGQQVRLVEE